MSAICRRSSLALYGQVRRLILLCLESSMESQAFKPARTDRLTIWHFRQSLPRSRRASFDASLAQALAKEFYDAVEPLTRGHIVIVMCVVCLVEEWQRTGLGRADAKARAAPTIMKLGSRTIRFFMWLIACFSRDPFDSIRRYSEERSSKAYGPSFVIDQVELERGFVSIVSVCGYRTILARHGADDLINLFCAWDRTWIEALPEKIDFRRPTTLAQGHDACRFEFRRKQN